MTSGKQDFVNRKILLLSPQDKNSPVTATYRDEVHPSSQWLNYIGNYSSLRSCQVATQCDCVCVVLKSYSVIIKF